MEIQDLELVHVGVNRTWKGWVFGSVIGLGVGFLGGLVSVISIGIIINKRRSKKRLQSYRQTWEMARGNK